MTLSVAAEYLPDLDTTDAHGTVRVTVTNEGATVPGFTLAPVAPLGYPYSTEYEMFETPLASGASVTVDVLVHFTTAAENAPAVPEFIATPVSAG